jgi:hypothetical protein
METKIVFAFLYISSFILPGCDATPSPADAEKIKVIINDIPFQTEKYLRIPYTLQTWEWEKEGLKLEQIIVLDNDSKSVLMTIAQPDLPFINKEPLDSNPYFTYDQISDYYLSIQLPIPLDQAKPATVSHRFMLRDTIQKKDIMVEGGVFSPRLNETPIAISSPVKGNNWLFVNQSTLGYHFFRLFFVDGKISRGERFAFDNAQLNDKMDNLYQGDPKVNESYFNYKDTLYAVADGIVQSIKDGRAENNGDAQDVPLKTVDELGGNYLVLNIGNGHYAFYAHCVPNSFMVKAGDEVKEGDPIGLLGNSGNSTAPHLHFQITDGTDLLFSNGLPFVMKKYTKVADFETGPVPPTVITHAMMEQISIVCFE